MALINIALFKQQMMLQLAIQIAPMPILFNMKKASTLAINIMKQQPQLDLSIMMKVLSIHLVMDYLIQHLAKKSLQNPHIMSTSVLM